jgi:hypothetical protein
MPIRPGAGQLQDPALPPQQLGMVVDDRGGELVTRQHAQLQLIVHHRIEHTFSLKVGSDTHRRLRKPPESARVTVHLEPMFDAGMGAQRTTTPPSARRCGAGGLGNHRPTEASGAGGGDPGATRQVAAVGEHIDRIGAGEDAGGGLDVLRLPGPKSQRNRTGRRTSGSRRRRSG